MITLKASCHKLKHFPIPMFPETHELGSAAKDEFIEVFHHTDLESALLITQMGFRFMDQVAHQVSRSLPFGPGCYFYANQDVALTEAMVNHLEDGVVIDAKLDLNGLKVHALSAEEFAKLGPAQIGRMADANQSDVIDLRGVGLGRGILVVRPGALGKLKITGVKTVPAFGRAGNSAGAKADEGSQERGMAFVDDLLTRFRPAA